MAELKSILKGHNEELALIVGNGINLANKNAGNESWNDILERIGRERGLLEPGQKLHETCSLVEFSDLLQLHSGGDGRNVWVQSEFRGAIENWKHGRMHKDVANWAMKHRIPILTTNFDTTLSDACGAELAHAKKGTKGWGGAPFTYYYPWSSRYEIPSRRIGRPRNSFAIWHVNGMSRYLNSVRLGLSHYMGSVQQARTWMHRGDDRLFASEEKIDCWTGRNTWLDAFFANDLLIFGLGLSRDEVFLRWLLIERAKYGKRFESKKRKAWYVCTKKEEAGNSDRNFFLKHVGVEIVGVNSFDEIYSSQVWNA